MEPNKGRLLSKTKAWRDKSWGCKHFAISDSFKSENVHVCYLHVSDLNKIALKLTESVQDTSWIMTLDNRAQRAYKDTAQATVSKLVDIFQKAQDQDQIGKEFGELVVSMGAMRALQVVFGHSLIPVSEIWKPQLSGNEGFDFHTSCQTPLINFGEAKFKSLSSSFRSAIEQSDRFILKKKHLRDSIHLEKLFSEEANINLENDDFGVVAAFSINSNNPLKTLQRALETLSEFESIDDANVIYLVGVVT
jgi:hypothetical protein